MVELQTQLRARRPRVWIVDDSPTEGLLTERSLGAGYEVAQFTDGATVVEQLTSSGGSQPDLLLVDWVMPGMPGDEVCAFLRAHERTQELPIILMTASVSGAVDVAHGFASGATDYVARPFAAEELRARIDAAIRAKQLIDLARQERRRLATINRLGRALFDAGTDVTRILDELTEALVGGLCDGCSILLLPGSAVVAAVTRHRADASGEALAAISTLADPVIQGFADAAEARAALPDAYAAYIDRFGLRGLAILPFPSRALIRGLVTVTRDGPAEPFDADDITTIETCIEYASLAVESALRFEAEQLVRTQTAHFQQQMLGIVGHDLRAPLGAIMIGTELLAFDTAERPAATSIIKRIASSALRMRRMVDQLLDMTRARLGEGIPIAPTSTSLLPLVQGVLDELALAHTAARLELVASTDLTGYWDPDRLGQVLSNVIGNAVQYGLAGAPITIAVGCTELAATITVHNLVRGGPMPAAVLATLFDPYRRGEDPQHNASGLGLGLYIVREIVQAHGGTIDVASEASGTTFRIVLPARGRPAA